MEKNETMDINYFDNLMKSYDMSLYPNAFLDNYTLMECLSDRNGISTFVVQDKSDKKYIAKCYDKKNISLSPNKSIIEDTPHPSLPQYIDNFENDDFLVTVREYIEGTPLDIYAKENELTKKEITDICIRLCEILGHLHHREHPIIHRDIKPQNIIVRPDKSIALIDFDIARIYQEENETDTVFFGTLAYAPPEQYGFSQTDARTDIYSLGILLRFLLTGSTRDNKNIRVYRPLAKIIKKCTGFSPKERFSDVDDVKKALKKANPKSQGLRIASIFLAIIAACSLMTFATIKLYQKITYSPFSDDAIPAYLSDEERIADGIAYMREKYNTEIFDEADDIATIGLLREIMIELYGLDHDYVYGINTDMPQESDEYFLPWGWDDKQTIDRDVMVYAAIKVHDPSIVADWSSLKDDNGVYPGIRVAVSFAEENGILKGVNRPGDLTVGDVALILANTDRVFEAAEEKKMYPF